MILTLSIVATATLSVVVGMNVVSSRRTLASIEAHLRASIVDKGRGLAQSQALALRDLVADNAFSDVGRLVEGTLERDGDLVYGLFVDEEGKPWVLAVNRRLEHFPRDWRALAVDRAPHPPNAVKVTHKNVAGETLFEFALPVVGDDGKPTGMLFYALSDASLRTALSEARNDSKTTLGWTVVMLLGLGASAIVLGMVLSRRAATRITRPVGDLTSAVKALAAGQREIRVQISSGDELETLGGAFNHMAGDLADSYRQLEAMNRTLEQKVQARTAELGQRNRDMRLVLDNVNQGFLTLSRSGVLASEHSSIVERWFGSYGPGATFVDYIDRVDPNYAANFLLGLEAIVDDSLPLDLCIEQLPSRLRQEGREYRCSYFPILDGATFNGLLVVINDVTDEIRRSRQEAERTEILAVFESLAQDRSSFLAFIDEVTEMMGQLPSADTDAQKRLLHTIKGSAGLAGFPIVAGLAHESEEVLADQSGPLTSASLAPLLDRWTAITASIHLFIGDKGRDVLQLESAELERVAEMIEAGTPAPRILDRIASWRLESAEIPLRRLGRHAADICQRLGKGKLSLDLRTNGIRLAPRTWVGLWTDLVHVVRNAVDHGLESPEERRKAHKPDVCHLRLETRVEAGNRLVVEIEDDGRGLNWGAVRESARRKALPYQTDRDLVDAIFAPGVSTSTEVTTVSGRGVGLAAVKQQVQDLGGTIDVETTTGRGCCFRFTFVLPEIGPRFGVEVAPAPVRAAA
jgi:two-component system chemotaxis sensor kinase CheA